MSVTVIHKSRPTVHPLQEYVLELEGESRWLPRIYDRYHLGQWVYPRMMPNRKDPLTDAQLLWVELFLMSRGAFLVHMTDDPQEIMSRVKEDKDESYIGPHEVATCCGLFTDAWYRSILPGVTTDLPNADPKEIVDRAAVNHLAYCGVNDAPSYMIGNTYNPDLIIVGDMLGRPNPPEATHRVPFAPYRQSSGSYLMSALLATRLTRRVAIVNSLTPDENETDLQVLAQTFPKARFLALGNEAWNRMSFAAMDWSRIGAVPHPQYARRFHHARLFEYARMIEEAGLEGADLRKVWVDA